MGRETIAETFIHDLEKMRDFIELTKEQFLASYSYISEESYNLTLADLLNLMWN